MPTLLYAEWIESKQTIMGTEVRIEIWHHNRIQGQLAIELAMQELHRIDRAMSPYKSESEISKANEHAAKRSVAITEEVFNIIQRSLDFSRLTEGAFDITFAAVGHLYDYRQRIRPTAQTIKSKLPLIDYKSLVLNLPEHTIKFARSGMRIDLGGIAKGYAVEQAATLLKAKGITNGIVTAGGDSRIIGDKRGRPWMIGIKHPRNLGSMVAILPLTESAISTSGDYERYFEEDGIRYHHILEPKTGVSATECQSVTIIGPDGVTTDALSTTVFVIGPKKGLAIIESMTGYDAIIVDRSGTLYVSRGLENLSQIENPHPQPKNPE